MSILNYGIDALRRILPYAAKRHLGHAWLSQMMERAADATDERKEVRDRLVSLDSVEAYLRQHDDKTAVNDLGGKGLVEFMRDERARAAQDLSMRARQPPVEPFGTDGPAWVDWCKQMAHYADWRSRIAVPTSWLQMLTAEADAATFGAPDAEHMTPEQTAVVAIVQSVLTPDRAVTVELPATPPGNGETDQLATTPAGKPRTRCRILLHEMGNHLNPTQRASWKAIQRACRRAAGTNLSEKEAIKLVLDKLKGLELTYEAVAHIIVDMRRQALPRLGLRQYRRSPPPAPPQHRNAITFTNA